MRIRIPKILKHSKSPPSPAGNYLVGRGRLFYFNSKEESAWHTGKSTFASAPTATTPAGQAMSTEPHSKRKAVACSKSWGGQLPWGTTEVATQSPWPGRIPRTKRSNLYIVDPVAIHVAEHFKIRRLCDKDGRNKIGNQFVAELIDELLQKGWLVSAKTSYGEGIRTATNKERGKPAKSCQDLKV